MPISHEELKQARLTAKLSQSAVAEKLGVTRQAISKWENGVNYPDIDNLELLVNLYHLPYNQVFGAPEINQSNTLVNENSGMNVESDRVAEKDESLILFAFTAVVSLIPIIQIIVPLYIIRLNKKSNRFYSAILGINIFVILMGFYTLYNIVTSILPM